jgi:hypothetical protein
MKVRGGSYRLSYQKFAGSLATIEGAKMSTKQKIEGMSPKDSPKEQKDEVECTLPRVGSNHQPLDDLLIVTVERCRCLVKTHVLELGREKTYR